MSALRPVADLVSKHRHGPKRAKGRHLQLLKSSQALRAPSLISNIPLDDNLAVRIGNLYALRLQNIPENQQRLSTDVGDAVLGIGDPKAENKLQRAVAECRQVTDNSALRQNPFKFRDGVDRKPAYCMRIRAVVNPELNFEPHRPVAERPVDNLLGYEGLVRD